MFDDALAWILSLALLAGMALLASVALRAGESAGHQSIVRPTRPSDDEGEAAVPQDGRIVSVLRRLGLAARR